jgi:hypothetical protein
MTKRSWVKFKDALPEEGRRIHRYCFDAEGCVYNTAKQTFRAKDINPVVIEYCSWVYDDEIENTDGIRAVYVDKPEEPTCQE